MCTAVMTDGIFDDGGAPVVAKLGWGMTRRLIMSRILGVGIEYQLYRADEACQHSEFAVF